MQVLTRDALIRAGACWTGVSAWIEKFCPDATVLSVDAALDVANKEAREYILEAAELDGGSYASAYGDDCSGGDGGGVGESYGGGYSWGNGWGGDAEYAHPSEHTYGICCGGGDGDGAGECYGDGTRNGKSTLWKDEV